MHAPTPFIGITRPSDRRPGTEQLRFADVTHLVDFEGSKVGQTKRLNQVKQEST